MSNQSNPCQFKQVCVKCTKATMEDRPHLCMAIKCEDFKLCPKCGQNRTLHHDDSGILICKKCFGSAPNQKKASDEIKHREETKTAYIANPNDPSQPRLISITIPGIPPPELTDDERTYYLQRWKDYKGYYRNPKAFAVCHHMILEELNLNYLTAKILQSRGEAESIYLKERQHSIGILKLLTDQLPDKEAEDVQDDEKSMAYIYDAYCKEKHKRYQQGTGRILSPEAVALAPRLEFPIDPALLLQRCGFTIEEIEPVLRKFEDNPSADSSPEVILSFFGFTLKEEYAMPYNVQDLSEAGLEETED